MRRTLHCRMLFPRHPESGFRGKFVIRMYDSVSPTQLPTAPDQRSSY
jgi:hypothetical protein